MDTIITQFLEILADNAYITKYKDVPDDVDNREEIIADIQETLDNGGLLPDSLRYFVLNGISDSKELASYLQKSFQQFKNEFLAGKHGDNDLFMNELLLQLDAIKNDIEQAAYEAKQLSDDSLNQMLAAKTSVCDEVSEFVTSTKEISNKITPEKEPVERLSLNWLMGHDLLQDFFDKMKSNKLIAKDTDINDFKAIFSNVPVSDIKKPVQWEQGAKLFAYFFHRLITSNYIPQRPTWILLQYCFTYYRGDIGKYVPIAEGVKAHATVFPKESAPKGSELVDVLFPNS
jgi:hypothetical protein